MRRATGSALVLLVAFAGVARGEGAGKVDFSSDILPLLKEECVRCHGPAKQSGGFRFDVRSSVMRKRGRLQPGSSATSMIYLRVAGGDFGPQMPLTGELTPPQIALIKDWIDQGAEWPNALAGKEAKPIPMDPAATAMIDAIRRGDAEALAALLTRHPSSTNRLGGFGATPLMVAALYGDVESARLLLRRGAKPNVANAARTTPLMWAAGDEEMTRLLLDHRADPNAVNVDGVSPLLVAATRSGASATVKLLLDRGAVPPRAGDRRSKRPSLPGGELQEAAFGGDAAMFRLLMERGADAKAADDGGYGVLFAARTGCAPCLDVLIPAAGKDELGAALVPLAAHGDTALLARLLDRGADVNAKLPKLRRDYRNRTPLMLAAGSDLVPLETVKLLVARGAELDATGPEGETALDLARRHGPTAVVRYLEQAGARPGRSSPPPSLTPRPAASAREALGRALPLLQRSDVRFVDKTGCFSCHNNTLTAMTVGAARLHGVPVDEAVAREQSARATRILEEKREASLLGGELTEVVSNIMVGLAAVGQPPDLTTDAMAIYLARRQLPDGHWRMYAEDHRPPLQRSDFDPTATSIRALRVYAPTRLRAGLEPRVASAVSWLAAAKPTTNDERAFQLLGLVWGGLDPGDERVRVAARALLAEQRSDGGWGQLASLGSDAYGTGQAMTALLEAGALRPGDAAYQRGAKFLLETQLEDGSWYVRSRSLPFQPYFESGFPHGHDQWVSAAATNWAAMALMPAAQP